MKKYRGRGEEREKNDDEKPCRLSGMWQKRAVSSMRTRRDTNSEHPSSPWRGFSERAARATGMDDRQSVGSFLNVQRARFRSTCPLFVPPRPQRRIRASPHPSPVRRAKNFIFKATEPMATTVDSHWALQVRQRVSTAHVPQPDARRPSQNRVCMYSTR